MNLIDKTVNAISPAWGEKRAEKGKQAAIFMI